MNAFGRVPTHIDYAHRMAEIAAEMAGYKLDGLAISGPPKDPEHHRLYRSFLRKGFEAVKLLGPAIVDLDPSSGDKVPDEVRRAGNQRGEHALTTVRSWRGLSIEALAGSAGVSPELISAIERREVFANEMHNAALGKALNVSPHAITDWRVGPELDCQEMGAPKAAPLDADRVSDKPRD